MSFEPREVLERSGPRASFPISPVPARSTTGPGFLTDSLGRCGGFCSVNRPFGTFACPAPRRSIRRPCSCGDAPSADAGLFPAASRSDGPRGPSRAGGEPRPRRSRKISRPSLVRHPSSSDRVPPGVGRPTSFDPIETRAALDGGLCEPGAFHRVERSAGAARSLVPARIAPWTGSSTPLEPCGSSPNRTGLGTRSR